MQKNKILYSIYAIICIAWLGIQGCKSTNDLTYTKNNNQPSYIYGEGYGFNFDIAKQNAIQDLATNLQVSITYSMQQDTQQKDNAMQINGLSKTSLETKIKDIPSIEVDKTWKQGNKVYLRVRVDRMVLEGAIMNRIQKSQQKLQTMLLPCETISFSHYRQFKKYFEELSSDITLYQILTKNMSYGNSMIASFQNSLAISPTYSISWDLHNLHDYEEEIKVIFISELSKFIKISSNAKQILHITANSDNNIRFFLHFKDCKYNPENTIQIDTYTNKKSMLNGMQKARLGAIIYKAIESNY